MKYKKKPSDIFQVSHNQPLLTLVIVGWGINVDGRVTSEFPLDNIKYHHQHNAFFTKRMQK